MNARAIAALLLALALATIVLPQPANADACSNAVTQFNAAYQHYVELVQAKGVTHADTIAAKNAYEQAYTQRNAACGTGGNESDERGNATTALCGDGKCESLEDENNCPEDCGSTPPDDDANGDCNKDVCVASCQTSFSTNPSSLQYCLNYCEERCSGTATAAPTEKGGCEEHYDCAAGKYCENGACASLGAGECRLPKDCAATAPEIVNAACVYDKCVEQGEYKFEFNTVFAKREKFYANGLGQVQLEFHAQKKTLESGVEKWIDASGLSVSFELSRDSGGMQGVELGALSKASAVTDSRGRATLAYTAPFVFAKSGAFGDGSGKISASIRARVEKSGKWLGGSAYYLEIHPPIYIEKLKANELFIDEHGKGGAYFRVKDSLALEKTVSFQTRHDEVSFNLEGPFAKTETKTDAGEKFDLYIQPLAGVRSIDLEDVTEWSGIYQNMKKSVLTESTLIAGNGVFKRLPKVGAPLEKWAGTNRLKIAVQTPSTYVSGYLAGTGSGQAGFKMGEARTGTEAVLYGATIVLEGVSLSIGVLTGNLKMEEGAKNGVDLLAATTINLLKEELLATAKAHRVANSREAYYPRTIRVNVTDVDGYEVHGWVPFYVLRYE